LPVARGGHEEQERTGKDAGPKCGAFEAADTAWWLAARSGRRRRAAQLGFRLGCSHVLGSDETGCKYIIPSQMSEH
jgi:hypothetical protein